jgi:hypothetical protein
VRASSVSGLARIPGIAAIFVRTWQSPRQRTVAAKDRHDNRVRCPIRSLTSLKGMLINLGAPVVSHGRYVTF